VTAGNAKRSWASPQKDKFRRQLAILDAARTIIVKSGEAGLTMREVAAQAGLSLATPYNLFGSKQAILEAILEEDYIAFRQYFDQRESETPLTRIFDMIDSGVEHYKRAPEFYRPILALVSRNPEAVLKPQAAYVREMVSAALAAGCLRPETSVALVSSAIVRLFRAVSQEWVNDQLTLDQFRDEIGAHFALLLASLVSDAHQKSLALAADRYRGAPPAETAAPAPISRRRPARAVG
jgi:AcrR family transcriptional regulator